MNKLCNGFSSQQNQLFIFAVEKPDVAGVNPWVLVRVGMWVVNGGLGPRHRGSGIKAASSHSRDFSSGAWFPDVEAEAMTILAFQGFD